MMKVTVLGLSFVMPNNSSQSSCALGLPGHSCQILRVCGYGLLCLLFFLLYFALLCFAFLSRLLRTCSHVYVCTYVCTCV